MRYYRACGLALLLQASTALADPAAGGVLMSGHGNITVGDASPASGTTIQIVGVQAGDLGTLISGLGSVVLLRTSAVVDTVGAVSASLKPSEFQGLIKTLPPSAVASPWVSIEGTGVRLPEGRLVALEDPAPAVAQPTRHRRKK